MTFTNHTNQKFLYFVLGTVMPNARAVCIILARYDVNVSVINDLKDDYETKQA